jgi:hypothetical protein
VRHNEKQEKNVKMMEMLKGNSIPERGEGKHIEGLHTTGGNKYQLRISSGDDRGRSCVNTQSQRLEFAMADLTV